MKTASENLREAAVAEELLLNYFNRYLYAKKIISAKEYALMTEKITERCNKTKNK